MRLFEMSVVDRVIISCIRVTAIAFFLIVLSASFGVAMTLAISILLITFSIFWIFRQQSVPTIFLVEWVGFGLLGWLIIRASFALDFSGVLYLLNEYRLFWVVPIVSIAVSQCLTQRELIITLSLGSLFYFLGSILMVFLGDPFQIIDYKRDIQNFAGPYLSLGGKFVHGLWTVGVVSIGFAILINLKSIPKAIGLTTGLLSILAFNFVIEESRTSYLMLASVFIIFLWCAKPTPKQFYIAIVVAILAFLALIVTETSFKSQLGLSLNSLIGSLSGEAIESSSIGQRLIALKALNYLSFEEALLGLGPSYADLKIDEWVQIGLLVGEPAHAKNLHSDVAHLLLNGGLPAVLLYFGYGYTVFKYIRVNCLGSSYSQHLILGFAVAVFAMIFISGIINSTLLDIRERHVVMAFFIMFLALIRQIGESHKSE